MYPMLAWTGVGWPAKSHAEMKVNKHKIEAESDAPAAGCSAAIVRRKYLTGLRPDIADELSVRIEFEGQHAFFPLGTNQRAVAARKGEAIRRAVAETGWRATTSRFVREFTLAIFWLPNPLTCTYATLFSSLTSPPVPRKQPARRVRLAVFEPDPQIRWGLLEWLKAIPECECVAAHDSATAFLREVKRTQPDLALFNAPPCAPASEHLQEQLARECPQQVGFPYGIYRDSEHAWYCVTGVDGGYYYRRRLPTQLLEPIANLWQAGKTNRDLVESQICHHIQTLFGLRAAAEEVFPGLTSRERDVLMGLRRGHTDKTLATTLGISSWTVHTHMKSLFDKLGVHTRAEAVARFFEK